MFDRESGETTDEGTEASTTPISDDGELTIPDWVRESTGITTPGEVRFRKTDAGNIVIENGRSPNGMRGFAKRHGEATTDKPATQLLRESREKDKRDLDARFGLTDE